MVARGDKTAPINLKIEAFNNLQVIFNNLQVIKDYYLVLGGGKIGTDFLRHARKNRFPFVLVIDRDENAPASREAQVLKTRSELVNLLRKKAKTPLQEETNENHPGPEESKRENKESEAYFYVMDMHSIPYLFSFGYFHLYPDVKAQPFYVQRGQ